MNTNEQAPDSCPFCGAGIRIEKDGSQCRASRGTWVVFNCCTTWHQGYREQRQLQSSSCATAERERLTRERDEARAVLMDPQALWINICRGTVTLPKGIGDVRQWQDRVKHLESEWTGWPELQREWFGDKYAAMQPWDAVRARIEDAEARVKRLEKAVGSLLPYAEATDDESSEWGPGRWKSEKLKRIIDEARKAKEAKP